MNDRVRSRDQRTKPQRDGDRGMHERIAVPPCDESQSQREHRIGQRVVPYVAVGVPRAQRLKIRDAGHGEIRDRGKRRASVERARDGDDAERARRSECSEQRAERKLSAHACMHRIEVRCSLYGGRGEGCRRHDRIELGEQRRRLVRYGKCVSRAAVQDARDGNRRNEARDRNHRTEDQRRGDRSGKRARRRPGGASTTQICKRAAARDACERDAGQEKRRRFEERARRRRQRAAQCIGRRDGSDAGCGNGVKKDAHANPSRANAVPARVPSKTFAPACEAGRSYAVQIRCAAGHARFHSA